MNPVPEIDSLPKEIAPPPGLEERVVARLRAQSLLRPRSRWLQAAAAVVLLASGFGIGRMTSQIESTPAPAASNRYLLLLTKADTSGDDAARAARYGQWAVEQRAAGRQISGERLADNGLAVTPAGSSPAADVAVQGFFIVSAASLEDAATVARSSPHVHAGGTVIVRPIDTP
jgi:hypothetical protein